MHLRGAVSRIKAKSDLYEMDLLLDINTDLYPMDVSWSLGPPLASDSVAHKCVFTTPHNRMDAELQHCDVSLACTGWRKVFAGAVADAECGQLGHERPL